MEKIKKLKWVIIFALSALLIANSGRIAYFATLLEDSNPYDVSRDEEFSGKLLFKYIDKHNHSIETLKLLNDQQKIQYQTLFISSMYDNANSGDYIIKKKGTIIYLLIKNQDTLKYKYEEFK